MRISEQKLNQIISESIQESLNSLVGGFNAARHNYKANDGQSGGNRVMNAANAGNQGYRWKEFMDALLDVGVKAKKLRDSGFISDEQYSTISQNMSEIRQAMRDMSHSKRINTYKDSQPEVNDYDGMAKRYFGK
jgi:hypothetical protein